jgi:hypothetical protein
MLTFYLKLYKEQRAFHKSISYNVIVFLVSKPKSPIQIFKTVPVNTSPVVYVNSMQVFEAEYVNINICLWQNSVYKQ